MPNTFVINGEVLKDFFGSINSTGSWTVILHIDPVKGFYGKITDTANTTLLNIQYQPNAFISYKCDKPREIGFDVKAFMAITSKIKKGTRKNPAPLVSLDIQDKEIVVSVNGETTNIRILEEKECRRETRTTFEFPEIMTVNYEELVHALKNAKKINDKSVSLIVSAGALITRSDSIFGDTLVKRLSSCTGVNGWFKTNFTPGLIIDCLKGMHKDIPVTVSTKTDYPLVLRQETEYSSIEYTIAPRIKTDIDKRVKKDPVWVQYLYSAGLISPDMGIRGTPAPAPHIPPVSSAPVNRFAYLRCTIQECSAHNPAGEWQHDEGKEPREVVE